MEWPDGEETCKEASYEDAVTFCSSKGGRLCTKYELSQDVDNGRCARLWDNCSVTGESPSISFTYSMVWTQTNGNFHTICQGLNQLICLCQPVEKGFQVDDQGNKLTIKTQFLTTLKSI